MEAIDHLSTDDDRTPPNEELLNVVREKGNPGVGTGDIVDEVDLGFDAVRDRMHGMEAEGRVTHDTIGSEGDYSFVWYLAESERDAPVNPDIARLVDWCEWAKAYGCDAFESAKFVGLIGIGILMLTLTAVGEGIPLAGFDPGTLLYLGWFITAVAAGIAALGGIAMLLGAEAEYFGEWLVEHRREQ